MKHALPHLLYEKSSHMLQLMRERWWYTYQPSSTARLSFTQQSEPVQCRVKILPQSINIGAKDSKPGSLSRELEALPLSHSDQHQ